VFIASFTEGGGSGGANFVGVINGYHLLMPALLGKPEMT
jgi:hypothetical protein